MKTIEVAEAQGSLPRYVKQVNAGPIVLTSAGKPVAALVSLANVDLESFLVSTNPKFISIIEESRERQRREGGIPAREIRRRLKTATGVTTQPNYRNRNGQRVVRSTKRSGTDHNQYIYILECGSCGKKYGVNGSDIHERKCPSCQGGKAGLKL